MRLGPATYLHGTAARRLARALLPAIGAGVVASCGAGYTKTDFIARADAICASTLRQTRAVGAQSGLAQYAAAVVPIVTSEAAQLRRLPRPPESARDRGILDRYFAALNEVVQGYRQLAVATHSGDAQGVASAEGALQASPIATLAASYGLRSCGSPGSTSV